MACMTREAIVASCKANGGYAAPALNEQLYLHCKGYAAIDNLDAYTNVKVLWLEQNAIESLSGLTQQQQLVSLFVQNNTIRSLTTLSAPLRNLRVLNVSYNYLTSLDGLAAACPLLETLQASHNHIASLHACRDMHALAGTLTSIDLSYNKIATVDDDDKDDTQQQQQSPPQESCGDGGDAGANVSRRARDVADEVRVVVAHAEDNEEEANNNDNNKSKHSSNVAAAAIEVSLPPPALVCFFAQMPLVSMLCLHGNPLTQSMRQYRRRMVQHLPALTYLDERPVFEEERRVVQAWSHGGAEGEKAERAAIREEKRAHLTSCVRVLHERMQANRDVRDRLVQQWDAQRAAELEATVRRRRRDAAARGELDTCESQARVLLVDDEAAAWAALCAQCDEAAATVRAHAAAAATAATQAVVSAPSQDVRDVMAHVQRDLDAYAATAADDACDNDDDDGDDDAAAAARHEQAHYATLSELVKSDEDVLRELEDDMQALLGDVDAHVARYTRAQQSPQAQHNNSNEHGEAAVTGMYDRTTGRAERALHTAVSRVAANLRGSTSGRAAAQRRELWRQFDAWQQQQQQVSSTRAH